MYTLGLCLSTIFVSLYKDYNENYDVVINIFKSDFSILLSQLLFYNILFVYKEFFKTAAMSYDEYHVPGYLSISLFPIRAKR